MRGKLLHSAANDCTNLSYINFLLVIYLFNCKNAHSLEWPIVLCFLYGEMCNSLALNALCK